MNKQVVVLGGKSSSSHGVHLIGIYEPQFDQQGETYLIEEGCTYFNAEYGTPEYDEALLKAIKLAQSFII